MCKVLQISSNSYYRWKREGKKINDKTKNLKEAIKDIFEMNKGIYGSPRIREELKKRGWSISLSYIGRLMKQMNLKSILAKKYVVTTDSKHQYVVAKNKLARDFTATQTGKKWVSDITYVRVANTWSYLTTIIDLADRKVVGWSLSQTMKTEDTVLKAWTNARANRTIKEGFIFHSDRGVQYASNKTRTILSFNKKITQSMSRKGNCWDNAVAESFFKSIKYEWLNRFIFENSKQLHAAIYEYIQWYNTKRLHSALGYKTPLEKQRELNNNYYKNVA